MALKILPTSSAQLRRSSRLFHSLTARWQAQRIGWVRRLTPLSHHPAQLKWINGVVATHRDVSRAQEMAGIKTTEISAGRYKRIASQYGPLTESGQAEIQRQIDGIYTIFVDAVAQNRGVNAEKCWPTWPMAGCFWPVKRRRAGWSTHIASLDATISNMANGIWPTNSLNRGNDMAAGSVLSSTPNKPATGGQQQPATAAAEITIEMLNEQHPQIVTQLMQIGADAERERIQSCEDAALPGHEKS